jgi:hypothetical protein
VSGSIFASVARLRELNRRVGHLTTVAEDVRQQLKATSERLDQLSVRAQATNERLDQLSLDVTWLREEMAFFEDRAREESFRLEELLRQHDRRRKRDEDPSEEVVRRVLETLDASLPALRAAIRVDFSTGAMRDALMMLAARTYLGSRLTTRLALENSACDAWLHWTSGRNEDRPGLLAEAAHRLRADALFVLIVPGPAEALGTSPGLRLLAILDLPGERPRALQAAVWQRV